MTLLIVLSAPIFSALFLLGIMKLEGRVNNENRM